MSKFIKIIFFILLNFCLLFSNLAKASEKIKIGKIIAKAWLNGITNVIKGTEIKDIDPPKPDLAIPYNIIAGTTVKRKNKFISILQLISLILNPMDLLVFVE